jgi:hypothetical protein
MRARTVLLGSIVILVSVDAAVMALLGAHVIRGPWQGARLLVCGGAAFLIARRSGRPGNAVRAVSTAFVSAALAVLISTTAYVLYGGAAANRHGPALLLAFIVSASLVGLLSGGAGAMAGWYAHRQAHRVPIGPTGEGEGLHGVPHRTRGARRKFP